MFCGIILFLVVVVVIFVDIVFVVVVYLLRAPSGLHGTMRDDDNNELN